MTIYITNNFTITQISFNTNFKINTQITNLTEATRRTRRKIGFRQACDLCTNFETYIEAYLDNYEVIYNTHSHNIPSTFTNSTTTTSSILNNSHNHNTNYSIPPNFNNTNYESTYSDITVNSYHYTRFTYSKSSTIYV